MLHIKKELWEQLFNSIDEGFCIIEMIFDERKKPIDYRFILINSSFERQTGLKDAVGKRMREFAPNHEEHWFEIYGKIALTGESLRFENRAEQLHRWYDVYAFRFGDAQNNQVAILFNDITERKQSEETIKQLNKELADNLHKLEFANKELEAFSYSVSHDLRAPIRVIDGYINILSQDLLKKKNEDVQKDLEAIRRNCKKMSSLIDDLLAFSHLGRNEITKKQVDMRQLVKEVAEDFCNQNSLKKTILKIGDILPVNGDSATLKQVWINLISNAYKYSQNSSPPSIEIGSAKEGNEVTYYVKDNGVGFNMKYYHKLFGIFQRLHGDSEFEGTGLGLAIVQRIVSRHGGKVWAEGKINEGASFYFSLPN